MSEKREYHLFKKNMPQGHDRLDRIENIVGIGTPDVNYCIDGVEGWIEMKAPKEPMRSTSKLLTKHAHPLSQDQKNWFLKQRNAGGRAYILIATNKRWMLIEGKHADNINDMTIEQLWHIAMWATQKPVNKYGWELLRAFLKE